MTIRIEGKIAAILSPSKVVINRGSNDGVEEGDYFYIYSQLGPFTDPDTKENIGSAKQIWGKVQVTTVERRFCIAETETRFVNPFFNSRMLSALLGGTTTEKIKLPVNEGQIWKGLEKVEIGFPALLVKQEEESVDELKEAETPQLSLLGPAVDTEENDTPSNN
jgi:hypothetical protein